ncbi:MAG: 4-alpha-glucanotransferase [Chloroflexi bacterium]|nr:MAG: 4-alpha-glucanotransferase [Chloroflexota bacterium]MBL1196846.1 4-alpha-glucanotransferase [Chloroflexota bacterium]NOH14141.1 4-alpha-glucanotransferase [Chloroflexota bacterium]
MQYSRSSGILLHPTSLASAYGIGDLGPEAYRFVDFLKRSGTGLWQMLPLNPTGYGDSPYQSFSAFAGNHYLISPELLIEDGLLVQEDLADLPNYPPDRISFGDLIPWKMKILKAANQRFLDSSIFQREVETFKQGNEGWLSDYALFMALKDAHGGIPWTDWEQPLRERESTALEEARATHAETIAAHEFWQFIFFRQWEQLHQYAKDNDVKMIGDIPIYVAHDSADVWAHPDMYYLDEAGQPTMVAGVPPDYFSPTGQLWGNPIYRWDKHAETGYAWWIKRFRASLELVEIVRLDHFRGFAGYWAVPGEAETAEGGEWIPGPGAHFFEAIKEALGGLPIIAEDLGEITPDVIELRDQFDLPGMKILQFAFDGAADHPFLPHTYPENSTAYTGVHDNETIRGWYLGANEHNKDIARRYLSVDGSDIAWDMIRSAWNSPAVYALAQMQDLLDLDNYARMNYPSTLGGNWQWRMMPGVLTPELENKLRELNQVTNRFSS